MSIAISQVTSRLRSVNAPDQPAVHWPSALVGLALAVLVLISVSWLAAPRRAYEPPVIATPVPPPAVPTLVPTPIPAPPIVEPTAVPAPEKVKVAGTGGSGVNLRLKAGEKAQRLKTVSEGTILEIVGGEETADGLTWRQVRDTGGTTGWVAGKFVTRIQP